MTGQRALAGKRALALALVTLSFLGCGGAAMTPLPAGYPLNSCPLAGPGSITPREGYRLIPPGEIAFAYETWHNETPDRFACGAQSIKGGKAIITPADFPSGILPWVATYRRSFPLQAAEQVAPEARLFSIAPAGSTLVEAIRLDLAAPQSVRSGTSSSSSRVRPRACTGCRSPRRVARSSPPASSSSAARTGARSSAYRAAIQPSR